MEDVILFCPICHGRLLSTDVAVSGHGQQRLPGEEYYCPHCEMYVAPDPNPPIKHATPEQVNPAEAPTNIGRTTGIETNDGGTQMGDVSNEGASWYRDPNDTSGSNWKEKD